MTSTIELAPECTAEQGADWSARFGAGYAAGRSDARFRQMQAPREGALIAIPADLPGETGAQYVTRHLELAWRIGYTRAWDYERAH